MYVCIYIYTYIYACMYMCVYIYIQGEDTNKLRCYADDEDYYTCVLTLLYMCPHTTIYVSSYYYI